VALSGDGYTALIGMVDDKGGMAAVYIRSKNRWSQLAGPPRGSFIFGEAIALSSNGATAAMGNGQKPAWVFYSAD